MRWRYIVDKWICILITFVIVLPLPDIGNSSEISPKVLIANILEDSEDQASSWIGVGIAEGIDYKLRKAGQLDLITRPSANNTLIELGKHLSDISDETRAAEALGLLKVDVVVIGSFVETDSGYSVELMLIGASGSEFPKTIKAEDSNISSVQTDLAVKLTEALGFHVGEDQRKALESRMTENSQAYIFYSKGAEHFYHGRLSKASRELEKSVSQDSRFREAKDLLYASKKEEGYRVWADTRWYERISFVAGYMPVWTDGQLVGGGEPDYHVFTAGLGYRYNRVLNLVVMYGVYVKNHYSSNPDYTPLHLELQIDLVQSKRARLFISPQFTNYHCRNLNGWELESGSENVSAFGAGLGAGVKLFSGVNFIVEGSWNFAGSPGMSQGYSDGDPYFSSYWYQEFDFSGIQAYGGLEFQF